MKLSNKVRIMEILFNLPHDVDSKLINWVQSHLPDNDEPGEATVEPKVKYDHKNDSLFEAIAIKDQDVDKLLTDLKDYMKTIPFDERTVSHRVEYLANDLTPKRVRILAMLATKVIGSKKVSIDDDEHGIHISGPESMPDEIKQALIKKLMGDTKTSRKGDTGVPESLKDAPKGLLDRIKALAKAHDMGYQLKKFMKNKGGDDSKKE
jgi:hypothetical protein